MYCIHNADIIRIVLIPCTHHLLESTQSQGVLIDRASETTINITLNKTEARSIHAGELLVVWYDRDDVTYHLNSKMFPVTSTVDQISIHIIKEKNYTVAVFCNSMYPCAIKTFEAIYTQSTSKYTKFNVEMHTFVCIHIHAHTYVYRICSNNSRF